jgi:hypothetical protein
MPGRSSYPRLLTVFCILATQERQDLEEYISEERRRAQDQHLIRRRTYFPVNIGAGATSLPVTMTVPNE